MNLFDLVAKITLDASEYVREIANQQNLTEGFAKKIGGAFSALGKVSLAGLGAAATGVGALAKSAISSYGEFEQLVGGVETLFKESADVVQEYARRSYETAGLSANEYMETVTSFSASLLQSLSGDTAAAADYADMAIRDMSDNANKMGTSMEAIQNAYQGFAKQNYTIKFIYSPAAQVIRC